MPLYEYHCSKCEKNFEVIQKFSDDPLKEHEGCGGHVERVISAPAFQLKGSGWYITDYARAGSKEGKPESKSDASASESKPEGSSEKKSGDSKSGDAKGDSKSSESKAESKPSAKAD